MPPREDVPLPTQPPYTAFVGNLPFDLTESELGSFFGPHEVSKPVGVTRHLLNFLGLVEERQDHQRSG